MSGDPQCHTRRCTVSPRDAQCHTRRSRVSWPAKAGYPRLRCFVTANSGPFTTPGADIDTLRQVAPPNLLHGRTARLFQPVLSPCEQSRISSAQDHDDRCRTVPTMLSCYAIVKTVIVPSKMQLSQVPPPDRRTLSCAASVRKIHAPQQHRVQAQAVSASATPCRKPGDRRRQVGPAPV